MLRVRQGTIFLHFPLLRILRWWNRYETSELRSKNCGKHWRQRSTLTPCSEPRDELSISKLSCSESETIYWEEFCPAALRLKCRTSALSIDQDVFISNLMTWNTDDECVVCESVWEYCCVTSTVKILMWWTDFVYLELAHCTYLVFYLFCLTSVSRNTNVPPLDIHQHITYGRKYMNQHHILYCTRCSEHKSHWKIHLHSEFCIIWAWLTQCSKSVVAIVMWNILRNSECISFPHTFHNSWPYIKALFKCHPLTISWFLEFYCCFFHNLHTIKMSVAVTVTHCRLGQQNHHHQGVGWGRGGASCHSGGFIYCRLV